MGVNFFIIVIYVYFFLSMNFDMFLLILFIFVYFFIDGVFMENYFIFIFCIQNDGIFVLINNIILNDSGVIWEIA